MAAIGCIGLGVMGEPVCANLLMKSGCRVLGYDPRPEPLARLCPDPGHEDGPHKARVFKAAFGFDQMTANDRRDPNRYHDPRRRVCRRDDARPSLARRSADCGPGGSATLRTGWIYEKGTDVPRLTTAYVLGRRWAGPPRRERLQLCQDLPEHGLRRGESGTVVHVFETPDAYLVEFVNPDSGTGALAELKPEQLAPAGA